MHPHVGAALTTWEWRLDVLVVVGLFAYSYVRGWVRLRRRGRTGLASGKNLASYLLGVLCLLVALLSFIDVYGALLLYMHMIQHVLLIMFVPVLLHWSHPFALTLWGLPRGLRVWITRPLRGDSPLRSGLRRVSALGILYALYIGAIVLWHDTQLYNLAQGNGLVHDVEHITFFGAGMLFWWPIFGFGPRLHGQNSLLSKMMVLLLCVPPHVVIGALLSFVDFPVYSHYESVPRIGSMELMQDQQLAGIIMWIPTSMMYIAGVVILLAQHLSRTAIRKPADLTDEVEVARTLE